MIEAKINEMEMKRSISKDQRNIDLVLREYKQDWEMLYQANKKGKASLIKLDMILIDT